MKKEETKTRLYKKNVHGRHTLEEFLRYTPEIEKCKFNPEKSEFSFNVDMFDIGFSYDMFSEKGKVSRFMINFVGEFLFRENIEKFAELMRDTESKKIIREMSSRSHKNFGLDLLGYKLLFSCHVSLLTEILTEDMKRLG